jgi:hypothetical protein
MGNGWQARVKGSAVLQKSVYLHPLRTDTRVYLAFQNHFPVRFFFFPALLLCSATLAAQPAITRTTARVTDFGQLYSTFSWEPAAMAELETKLGPALAKTVMAASNEAAWPAGIASLNGRIENREGMNAYTLYHIATLQENKVVLLAPALENRNMPGSMQPASDIYFIVGLQGVELSGISVTVKTTIADPPRAESFATQLEMLTRDFSEGFINMKGEQTDEDEEGMTYQYASRVHLEGASQVYFMEDLMSASTVFQAVFPGSTDPAIALKAYRNLVRQVEALKLTCCPLSKKDERVDGNRHSQSFQAYDPNGRLEVAYQSMILEVYLVQGETTHNGQMVSNWIPMLSIYEN